MKDKNNQWVKKRKLEGRGIPVAYRTTEEKENQNPSHFKGSKNKRSHSKAVYELLDGYYNTLREKKYRDIY